MQTIEGVTITSNMDVPKAEVVEYINFVKNKFPDQIPVSIELEFTDDDVQVSASFKPIPIERIRRITGYLVGTLDRFNDAKVAEEKDRVKHC